MQGLRIVNMTWVLRMDTDDICVPNRFEQQINFIQQHPDISVCGGQIIEFNHTPNDGVVARSPSQQPMLISWRMPNHAIPSIT